MVAKKRCSHQAKDLLRVLAMIGLWGTCVVLFRSETSKKICYECILKFQKFQLVQARPCRSDTLWELVTDGNIVLFGIGLSLSIEFLADYLISRWNDKRRAGPLQTTRNITRVLVFLAAWSCWLLFLRSQCQETCLYPVKRFGKVGKWKLMKERECNDEAFSKLLTNGICVLFGLDLSLTLVVVYLVNWLNRRASSNNSTSRAANQAVPSLDATTDLSSMEPTLTASVSVDSVNRGIAKESVRVMDRALKIRNKRNST